MCAGVCVCVCVCVCLLACICVTRPHSLSFYISLPLPPPLPLPPSLSLHTPFPLPLSPSSSISRRSWRRLGLLSWFSTDSILGGFGLYGGRGHYTAERKVCVCVCVTALPTYLCPTSVHLSAVPTFTRVCERARLCVCQGVN